MKTAKNILFNGLTYRFCFRLKKGILFYCYDGTYLVVQHQEENDPTHQYFVIGVLSAGANEELVDLDYYEYVGKISQVRVGKTAGYALPID